MQQSAIESRYGTYSGARGTYSCTRAGVSHDTPPGGDTRCWSNVCGRWSRRCVRDRILCCTLHNFHDSLAVRYSSVHDLLRDVELQECHDFLVVLVLKVDLGLVGGGKGARARCSVLRHLARGTAVVDGGLCRLTPAPLHGCREPAYRVAELGELGVRWSSCWPTSDAATSIRHVSEEAATQSEVRAAPSPSAWRHKIHVTRVAFQPCDVGTINKNVTRLV